MSPNPRVINLQKKTVTSSILNLKACSLVNFLGVWRCNQELQGRDGPVGPLSAVAFSSANVASGVPDDPNSRPATSGGRVGKGRGGGCGCWG